MKVFYILKYLSRIGEIVLALNKRDISGMGLGSVSSSITWLNSTNRQVKYFFVLYFQKMLICSHCCLLARGSIRFLKFQAVLSISLQIFSFIQTTLKSPVYSGKELAWVWQDLLCLLFIVLKEVISPSWWEIFLKSNQKLPLFYYWIINWMYWVFLGFFNCKD